MEIDRTIGLNAHVVIANRGDALFCARLVDMKMAWLKWFYAVLRNLAASHDTTGKKITKIKTEFNKNCASIDSITGINWCWLPCRLDTRARLILTLQTADFRQDTDLKLLLREPARNKAFLNASNTGLKVYAPAQTKLVHLNTNFFHLNYVPGLIKFFFYMFCIYLITLYIFSWAKMHSVARLSRFCNHCNMKERRRNVMISFTSLKQLLTPHISRFYACSFMMPLLLLVTVVILLSKPIERVDRITIIRQGLPLFSCSTVLQIRLEEQSRTSPSFNWILFSCAYRKPRIIKTLCTRI